MVKHMQAKSNRAGADPGFLKEGLQISIDHAYFSHRICIVRGANGPGFLQLS